MRESRTNSRQNARSGNGGAVDTPRPRGSGQLLILPELLFVTPAGQKTPPPVTATTVSPAGAIQQHIGECQFAI